MSKPRPPLKVLLLEDDPRDAELILEAMRDAGYDCDALRVDSREGFDRAADSDHFDVILADYALPRFDGAAALEIARRKLPETPFIFVSGAIGEERAIETLRQGATDYVLKHKLERIGPAVDRALREVKSNRERNEALEALRQSEANFRLIAEMIPQIVWTSTPDGHIVYQNSRLTEYTGVDVVAADRNKSWREVIHPEDTPQSQENWTRSLATGDPFEIEYRLRGRDGSYRWFLGRAQALRDSAGKIIWWFGTATDIDARRRADEMIQAAKEELEQASQAKDEFLAAVSHELRTPLTSILGWASLVKSNDDPALLQTALSSILGSARAQAQLIDDLLDASRLLVGKIELNLELSDLCTVVRSAVDAVHPSAVKKGVSVHMDLPPSPLHAHVDRHRVQQIVWNLLTNAVKFTPSGGLVQVVLRPGEETAMVMIRDTGIGISREFLPHLFGRFTQERSGSHGGLGLGLAISQHLTAMHGGTLTASSDGVGKGATFTLTLPVTVKEAVTTS